MIWSLAKVLLFLLVIATLTLGAEVLLEAETADGPPTRLLLLVQSRQGYLNLSELLARAWTRNVVRNQALCTWDWLAEHRQGGQDKVRLT